MQDAIGDLENINRSPISSFRHRLAFISLKGAFRHIISRGSGASSSNSRKLLRDSSLPAPERERKIEGINKESSIASDREVEEQDKAE